MRVKIAAGSRSHRVTDARNVREGLSAELRNVDVFFVGAASSRDAVPAKSLLD